MWVAILALVVMLLMALASFAFMRPQLTPSHKLYCDTLLECLITTIRFNLIGDFSEACQAHHFPIISTSRNYSLKIYVSSGQSLIWVGVLIAIVIYQLSLTAFALLRPGISEVRGFYCRSFLQCFVSVIRFGLVGDMKDVRPGTLPCPCFSFYPRSDISVTKIFLHIKVAKNF